MTYYPQLAVEADITSLASYIDDDNWVMEQKLDGHRLLLHATKSGSVLLNRHGAPYTKGVPVKVANFVAPGGAEWVIDGELVDGKFWVFDLPVAPGVPAGATQRQRRAALETLLGAIPHPFHLVPQAKARDEKIALADRALKEGFEGLMLKRSDSIYIQAGRLPTWLKLKFVSTVDCLVAGVRTDDKDSVDLALVRNGTPELIGRASLIGKEKNYTINVGDVVEVKYLYVGAQGRLYQPRILRLRDDKLPHECTGDQLRHVNKAVLASF